MVGGFDSEKTRLKGSAASMFATSVDPHRVSWYTNPFGGTGSLPSSAMDFCERRQPAPHDRTAPRHTVPKRKRSRARVDRKKTQISCILACTITRMCRNTLEHGTWAKLGSEGA